MLIRFEIQMGGNGTVSSVQAQPNADPNAPVQKQTPAAYVAPQKGGDPPLSGLGTGMPGGQPGGGTGTVFVVGPIVVFGSTPGGAPGGDPPLSGLGTGKSGADAKAKKDEEKTTAKDEKDTQKQDEKNGAGNAAGRRAARER